MIRNVKALLLTFALLGASSSAFAQGATKHTGSSTTQSNPGTVIVAPANPPVYQPAPVPVAPNQTYQQQQIEQQIAQIRAQEAQLRQQQEQLRAQERQLRQQLAAMNGTQVNNQQYAQKGNNGKHKGWGKKGKDHQNRDND